MLGVNQNVLLSCLSLQELMLCVCSRDVSVIFITLIWAVRWEAYRNQQLSGVTTAVFAM